MTVRIERQAANDDKPRACLSIDCRLDHPPLEFVQGPAQLTLKPELASHGVRQLFAWQSAGDAEQHRFVLVMDGQVVQQ